VLTDDRELARVDEDSVVDGLGSAVGVDRFTERIVVLGALACGLTCFRLAQRWTTGIGSTIALKAE